MTPPSPQGANGHKRTAAPCACGCERRILPRTCYVTYKCRHAICEDANRRYNRRNSKSRLLGHAPYVDAGPVREQLLRFAALGVGYRQVAATAGVSKSSLLQVRSGEQTRVLRRTAERVLALHDRRLVAMPTPDDVDDPRDIDQVAIDRRYDGCWTVKLNREEKAEAVRQGLARGMDRTTIANRLGYNSQTINAIADSLDAAAA